MRKLKLNLISSSSSHTRLTLPPQVTGKPDSYETAVLEIGQKTAQDNDPWEEGNKQQSSVTASAYHLESF